MRPTIAVVQTLIYIHGLGDDETTWQSLWRELPLNDIDHRAYVVPGMGDRQWSGERVEDVAKDLTVFVGNTAAPVVLVGHSLGGAIATLVCEAAPENVVGFVNVEGNLTPADCNISGAAARASDFDRWFELFAGKMPPRYAQALTRTDPRAFRAMAEDLVRVSDGLADRYAALATPKLAIYGTDGYAPHTQEWVRLSGVDSVCVEGAGHWVQEDRPNEVAVAIRSFLEGLVN